MSDDELRKVKLSRGGTWKRVDVDSAHKIRPGHVARCALHDVDGVEAGM